ncbi:MAG: glycosyltransferase [Gaiellaceae bacterium]
MSLERKNTARRGAPLVSLVMPVWNPKPAWLRQSVLSALGQVGCEIELIVVDDGSDTAVEELLEGLDDDRMRLVRVPHGRVSSARNAGIEVARGEYFRFVDSDDVILPDSTSHLLAITHGKVRVIAYGATLACDEELRPLSLIGSTLQGNVAESCLLNRFDMTIHSLLFPRSVVEEIGPWEPSLVVSEDWDYSLRAFERAPVRGDRRIATHYRLHPDMSSRNPEEAIRGYRSVVDRYFERHPDQRSEPLHRRALALSHLFAASRLATVRREYRASFAHVRRAVALHPRTGLSALPRFAAMGLMLTARRSYRFLTRR